MLARTDLPAADFFLPRSVKERRFRARVDDAVRRAPRVLHLTHAYCLDGAACDALVRMARGSAEVATLWLEPHETLAALERVAAVPGRGRDLVVSDLSFQKGEGERVLAVARTLVGRDWRLQWRDHHHKQWEGAPLGSLAQVGTFMVDSTGTDCGATLVQQALLPDDSFARELAAVVRDHDLWLLKDPRSRRLHAAVAGATSAAFVARVLATRSLDDPQLATWADAHDARRGRLVAEALAHARLERGERAVVGVAYGRVPTNDVLHALEERGAHLSVLLKPDGVFSLRSAKHVPVCQRIASRHGGGGHPNASGGKLDVARARLPAYWWTRGDVAPARALVAEAVREVDAHLAGSGTAT